jgi:hypothetical protein
MSRSINPGQALTVADIRAGDMHIEAMPVSAEEGPGSATPHRAKLKITQMPPPIEQTGIRGVDEGPGAGDTRQWQHRYATRTVHSYFEAHCPGMPAFI